MMIQCLFLFIFFLEIEFKTYTANAQQTQSQIPPTIDEESTNIPTGNGDAINHAPMLQVTICLSFPTNCFFELSEGENERFEK